MQENELKLKIEFSIVNFNDGKEVVILRYSGLIMNDIAAAPGLSVSFFTQGCPHRCKGCHNPETWDYEGGLEFTPEILDNIIKGLTAQKIQRNLCIMGGEPLCPENIFLTYLIVNEVREKVPNTKIYIWTGYTYKQLLQDTMHSKVKGVLEMADYLIDGPYIEELRDITLPLRGSSNQQIIELKN